MTEGSGQDTLRAFTNFMRRNSKRNFIQAHPFCAHCGAAGGRSDNPLTIDHVVPLSRGGRPGVRNWQVLCRECNGRKGSLLLPEAHPFLSDVAVLTAARQRRK